MAINGSTTKQSIVHCHITSYWKQEMQNWSRNRDHTNILSAIPRENFIGIALTVTDHLLWNYNFILIEKGNYLIKFFICLKKFTEMCKLELSKCKMVQLMYSILFNCSECLQQFHGGRLTSFCVNQPTITSPTQEDI